MNARSRTDTPFAYRIPVYPIWSLGRGEYSEVSDCKTSPFLEQDRLLVTSGRVAIAHALIENAIGAGDEILLPGYHCPAMVAPIEWCGATPVFYGLHEDMSADVDDVAAKISSKTRLIIAVHFFGFPQLAIHDLRELCDVRNLLLLEDCAHAFFGEACGSVFGSVGDFAIASAMKFFPVTDGGILIGSGRPLSPNRLRAPSLMFEAKSLLDVIEKSGEYRRLGVMSEAVRALSKLKARIRRSRARSSNQLVPQSSSGGLDFEEDWFDVAMSRVSRFILNRSSIDRLITLRRRNYAILRDGLEDVSGARPLFKEILEKIVPYAFPYVVDVEPDNVFGQLRSRGIPIYRWEDSRAETCPVTANFRSKLIHIPCHQDLNQSELDWMISEIRRCLGH